MAIDEHGLPSSARALLDAVVAVSSDLDLARVLDRIIMAACQLTQAQYGALGVLGDDDQLAEFITYGMDPHTREQIGGLPHGRGILGLIIDHPQALRLTRLQDHPASYGFPENHPNMDSFLGVPIRIRDRVFGNLYLTEKSDGPFTRQDEELVSALATTAGLVIENARAYTRSERQRAWLEAAAVLHEELRPPVSRAAALRSVAVNARSVSQAPCVGIVVRDDADGTSLGAVDGPRADDLPEIVQRLETETSRALVGEDLPPVPLDEHSTAVVAPLQTHLLGTAALIVVWDDVDGAVDERDLLLSYADQVALILDRVQAVAEREELAVVTDRDRIARDLHDLVIQRLFAIGLLLQGTRPKAVNEEVKLRIDQAVTEIDTTITEIRSTIFQLRQPQTSGLRKAARSLITEYVPALGFTPVIRASGPVDSVVSGDLASQALAVLREAMSNLTRHAEATSARVDLRIEDDTFRLCVSDDGVGLPADHTGRRESGLRNVRMRATQRGGAMRLEHREPHGTVLEWSVPLAHQ